MPLTYLRAVRAITRVVATGVRSTTPRPPMAPEPTEPSVSASAPPQRFPGNAIPRPPSPAPPALTPTAPALAMPSTAETLTEQSNKPGTSCIPCAANHLSTCAGLLSEALRFARSDGLASPDVIERLGLCQDELNAMERVDLRAEVTANLAPREKTIASAALVGARHARHKLEHLQDAEELETLAGDIQTLRGSIGAAWWKAKFKGLPAGQQERVKARLKEETAARVEQALGEPYA